MATPNPALRTGMNLCSCATMLDGKAHRPLDAVRLQRPGAGQDSKRPRCTPPRSGWALVHVLVVLGPLAVKRFMVHPACSPRWCCLRMSTGEPPAAVLVHQFHD